MFPLIDNPRGLTFLAVATVFLTLDFVAVGLRFWARRIKRTPLTFNDWAIALALLFTSASYTVTILGCILGGNGLHTKDRDAIDPGAATMRRKLDLAIDLLWCVIVTLIKLSVLHLYIVIFPLVKFRRITYGVIATQVLLSFSFTIGLLVQCRPIAYFWDKSIEGHCVADSVGFILTAILNLVMDFVVVFLPLRVVWRLQMNTSRKIAVSSLFGLGLIICVITAVRVKLAIDDDQSDPNYTWIVFGLFTTLEFYLGIITACLPILPPVGSHIAKSFHDSIFSIALSWTRLSTRRLLSRSSKMSAPQSPNLSETGFSHHNGYSYPTQDPWAPEGKTTAAHVKP